MLKAIYKTGSSLFLNNPNDVDLVYYYETKEERREALINAPHDSVENIHFDIANPKVFLGCYIYHFMELVEGDDLHLNEFSIFDHKEEYIELLKRYASFLPQSNKQWYHILTACYMFANNSYELTATQLKAIQTAHDKGITNAKYEYCLKQLNIVL